MTGRRISIMPPKKGAIVESSFNLLYVLRKGVMADHAHVFLDGNYQKELKRKFRDAPSGHHTIIVKVATHDHDRVLVSDTIATVVE